MKKNLTICFALLVCFSIQIFAQVPTSVLVNIVKAEDERRYDKTLEDLMKNASDKIRARAALAAGRIGDERAVPMLINLLENDTEAVRPTAAFALGEIESTKAADTILKVLKVPNASPEIRARLTEAAGKIAAANAKDPKAAELGDAILDVLDAEARKPKQDRLTILLGLTAILRARPEEGDFIAAKFLTNIDARVRADAANTLSRIRAKTANEQLRTMLLADDDAIVRANAARALGAAEDKDAFNLLLEAATEDEDSRVRVSAIRSLGNLKDKKAADKLLERGEKLLVEYKKSRFAAPTERNEVLEIATTLGRILPNSNGERAVKFLKEFSELEKSNSPEIEVALARISPKSYLNTKSLISINYDASKQKLNADWKAVSSAAQGLGETANLEISEENSKLRERAVIALLSVIENPFDIKDYENVLARALPDVLRAFAQFKTNNLPEVLRGQLKAKDAIVRATAAELLGDLSPDEANFDALKFAFYGQFENDKNYNDAQLAILDALVKQDKEKAKALLLAATDEFDVLVRRKAFDLLSGLGIEKDSSGKILKDKIYPLEPFNTKMESKLGVVLNSNADYTRAISRKNVRAILTTAKGTFTIELLPEAAPLTVDNFIKLARSNYFNGLAIHRVVPNFVMQDGDPRGDGNGGPGWQIRCEMNMQEYERGAVGMALSGKDTGGSQWFVTHSPQPHLDGGYTVFGRVNETDMKVVDNLVRGDKILSVKIVEGNSPQKGAKGRKN